MNRKVNRRTFLQSSGVLLSLPMLEGYYSGFRIAANRNATTLGHDLRNLGLLLAIVVSYEHWV